MRKYFECTVSKPLVYGECNITIDTKCCLIMNERNEQSMAINHKMYWIWMIHVYSLICHVCMSIERVRYCYVRDSIGIVHFSWKYCSSIKMTRSSIRFRWFRVNRSNVCLSIYLPSINGFENDMYTLCLSIH
jgi:hypothetical protein